MTLVVTKHTALLRVRRRTLLRLWWGRKRMTSAERELHDAFSERITDAFINGTRDA